MTAKNPRSFTYRIPGDDSKAHRKINVLDSLHADYYISRIPSSKIPNGNAVKNWGHQFFESREHFDYDRNEMVGGVIPGLAKYRYSREWEPTPETELLEMKHGRSGGTKIRGEWHIGTSDPRLPDYAPIDTVVPWTPGEIRTMYDGRSVPDQEKSHMDDPPEISAADARDQFRALIELAAQQGMDKCEKKLEEYIENCEHKIIAQKQTSGQGRDYETGYCEDCGRTFDRMELEFGVDSGELSVIGHE